jgi:DNA-binding transcriptional ArsR family regulator
MKINIGVDTGGWYVPEVLTDEGGTSAADIKKEELISLLTDKREGMDFDSLRTALRAPRPRLQQWLRELKDEGIVEIMKKGRGTVYVLTLAAKTERLEEESM